MATQREQKAYHKRVEYLTTACATLDLIAMAEVPYSDEAAELRDQLETFINKRVIPDKP